MGEIILSRGGADVILGILIGWMAATLMATLVVGLSDLGNRRYQQGWMDAMRQENPPEAAEIEGEA